MTGIRATDRVANVPGSQGRDRRGETGVLLYLQVQQHARDTASVWTDVNISALPELNSSTLMRAVSSASAGCVHT